MSKPAKVEKPASAPQGDDQEYMDRVLVTMLNTPPKPRKPSKLARARKTTTKR